MLYVILALHSRGEVSRRSKALVHVLVVEPGEVAAAVEAGECSPWLRQVNSVDALAALANVDFVGLHALPCRAALNFNAWAADGFALRSPALRPFLPEHPWFSRGGAAFIVDGLAREGLPSLGDDRRITLGLACAQLFSLLRSATAVSGGLGAADNLAKYVSSGDDLAFGLLRPGRWREVSRSRWAGCIFATLAAIGELACSLPGPHGLSVSCAEDRPALWGLLVSRALGRNVTIVASGHAHQLSEVHVAAPRPHLVHTSHRSSNPGSLLELSVQARGVLGELASPASKRRTAATAAGWRSLRTSLCTGRRSAGIQLVRTASGAVVRVLGVSLAPSVRASQVGTRAVLELLAYVEAEDGCAEMFTVGACKSLSRAALLAWRCDFHKAGARSIAASTDGTASSHYGTELVIHCPLPPAHALGVTRATRAFGVSLAASSEPSWGVEHVRVCVHTRRPPRWRVVGCSSPLWLSRPADGGLVRQWLAYHRVIGFDHFFVYDLDGTLAVAVRPFVEAGFVTYVSRWPKRLSPTCSAVVTQNPSGLERYCTQTQAEAHCIWHARGLARWALLVHSFDAYISAAAPPGVLAAGIVPVLAGLEPARSSIAAFTIFRYDFSCGPGCSDGDLDLLAIERFRWRQRVPQLLRGAVQTHFDMVRDSPFDHGGAVLVNPDNVIALLTHWARGRSGTIHAALPPEVLRLNHYVEILGDGDRCARQAREGGPPCDVPDDSVLWAAAFVRPGLWAESDGATDIWHGLGRQGNTSGGIYGSGARTKGGNGAGADMWERSDSHEVKPCGLAVPSSGQQLLVVVPGHGVHTRTPVIVDNLRRLRGEVGLNFRCLVFVYHVNGGPFPFQVSGDLERCTVVRRSGMFLEFLLDEHVAAALEGADFVLLMLDDIALSSPSPMTAMGIMQAMRRNRLDVASASLVGTHRSYEGMRPAPLRRGAVGRLTNFIELQMPMFTRPAFDVFVAMIRPGLSSTWGYDALYHGAFLIDCGRSPRMGIIDTMQITHTGAWLTSTMDERGVESQERALQAFYLSRYNVSPVEERMHIGKLLPH